MPAPRSMNQTSGVPARFSSVRTVSSSFFTNATSWEMPARPRASEASSPPVMPSGAMWVTFGGHLVPCEEPATALTRELEEELGIKVSRPRFLGIYEDVDPTSKDLFRHYLFFVTRWAGEPRIANEEHSEIRWFAPEQVDSLDVAPSIKAAIHQVLPTKP